MTSSPDFIERKAVNVAGRLGSLYNAVTDNLINRDSFQATSVHVPEELSVCQVFHRGQSNDAIEYLEYMDFDSALQLSLLVGMVKMTGVSSVITYNQPINDNIHFLYYSYRSKVEELSVTKGHADQTISMPSFSTNATHMITKIVWGFEILCVIPITNRHSSDTVNSLLQSISKRLKDNTGKFVLTDVEEQHILQLDNVTIYGSETCIDDPHTPLSSVLNEIPQWQKYDQFHHPLSYMMHSLRWLYNNNHFPEISDMCNGNSIGIAKIKLMITSSDSFKNYYQQLFESFPKDFSNATLNRMLNEVQHHFHTWSSTYKKLRKSLEKLLTNVRRGRRDQISLYDEKTNEQYASLKSTEMTTFINKTKDLLNKVKLIEQLNGDDIQYINVSDLCPNKEIPITKEYVENGLQDLLLRENIDAFILYSTDRLKNENSRIWKKLYKQFISERQTRGKTMLIYLDFTECQYDLEHPSIEKFTKNPLAQSPTNFSPEKSRPTALATEINVLLLGETGVGKSTFINAFVNYLFFDTLQQAEQNEPIVLIPVSFVTTVGDQFDEFTVKFGDVDANEDHEQQGQSVTQQCKSYLFQLNDKLHLRFIDTPGMGDTRGVDQDDKNIDHILTYVNNLSHLNAICLLLKPNTSRLNVFFRSCIHQLLTYLTPIGYNNITFCFTNARSTFFAPGNTGPLLRKMLAQEHVNDVPFQKQNTFCFDSESFRYLAARRCGVTFDRFETDECIRSWSTSVAESRRLLNFIQTRESYSLHEWQSPRKCALDIFMLARPLMETLRLILYNWKLRETGKVTHQITLQSKAVTVDMCTNCAHHSIAEVGPLRVVQYESSKSNAGEHCVCPADRKHFLIEYTVQHLFAAQPIDLSHEELQNRFHELLYSCDRLTHFLRQKQLTNHVDPFKPVLERFLDEERQIPDNGPTKSSINREVKGVFRSIGHTRQQNAKKLKDSNEVLSLNEVDRIIDQLKSMLAVNNQIESFKTSRRLKMKAHECLVKIPDNQKQNIC